MHSPKYSQSIHQVVHIPIYALVFLIYTGQYTYLFLIWADMPRGTGATGGWRDTFV